MTNDQDGLALSVVIPVYGSEAILPELTSRLARVLAETPAFAGRAEVVMVCDASPDDSWRVLSGLTREHGFLTAIRLRKNVGQHNAIMAGVRRARGAVVVTMDDDLQHSPSDIPALYAKIVEGADVCYVTFAKHHHAAWKLWGSRLNDVMARYLLGKPKNLYLSSFKAFRREIAEEIGNYPGPFVYIDGLILASTGNIASVGLDHNPRLTGKSGYSFKKSVLLWTEMATGFSVTPLRLASTVGLLTSGLGFVLAILFVIQKLTLDRMPDGWSSLIVTVLIMGGVQLLALGAIGEYLGRVLLTSNRKPQYNVAETLGGAS
ncbi:MAG: glycosyltransferase family 2 protein [Alphaproteobacteria bacterium]|nr:glycosyltransferase family 2 protein [Alphaproteobacteria bacterium]